MNHQHTKNTSPKAYRYTSNGLYLDVDSTNTNSSGVIPHKDKVRSFHGHGCDLSVQGSTMRGSVRSSLRIQRLSSHTLGHLQKKISTRERTTSNPGLPSPSGTEKGVVSDDDDSVSNQVKNQQANGNLESKRVEVTEPMPPTPLPVKLNTSQIHSKKYPFPNKLFDLLMKASSDSQSSEIVSWTPDGDTFIVHNHARFAAEILPTYFGHTQFRSFDRQLNYWGFELVSPRTINNKSFGGKSWKHPFFHKDRRDLLKQVTRKLPRGTSSSKRGASSNKGNKNARGRDKNYQKKKSSILMDTRIHDEEEVKRVSAMLCFPPRMVSPVHGGRRITNFRSPVQMPIVPGGNVRNNTFPTVEDAFRPLFPLEVLDGDSDCKQKVCSKGNNNDESGGQVDVFGGTSFHDVDLNMDMGIDMDMSENMNMDAIIDETELLLNVIEDIDNCNDDDYFSPASLELRSL